jgi:hypothetical protein
MHGFRCNNKVLQSAARTLSIMLSPVRCFRLRKEKHVSVQGKNRCCLSWKETCSLVSACQFWRDTCLGCCPLWKEIMRWVPRNGKRRGSCYYTSHECLLQSSSYGKSRVRFLVQCCRLALERTHVGQYGNYGYLFWREDVGMCCPFLMVLLHVTCVYFCSFLCCTNWILFEKNYVLLPTWNTREELDQCMCFSVPDPQYSVLFFP